MNTTAAERKRRDFSRLEERENVGHFATKADEIPRVEVAGSLERKLPTEKTLRGVLSLVEAVTLQLVSRRAKKVKTSFD